MGVVLSAIGVFLQVLSLMVAYATLKATGFGALANFAALVLRVWEKKEPPRSPDEGEPRP